MALTPTTSKKARRAFVVFLWQIWKNRNLKCFQNSVSSTSVSTKTVLNYVKVLKDISFAVQSQTSNETHSKRLIFWSFSLYRWCQAKHRWLLLRVQQQGGDWRDF